MHKRKLIEVALPLEAINRESAREKSIRHGHPSTLHLWWARRPLAAARAVLFAQLVDDPSARPEEFPTEELQRKERDRLHVLIERLVVWENIRDETLLAEANAEILRSTGGHPPRILDPFAGGGTIPLEAQRLGLEAHASDLNPVAVLINKALIEIPVDVRNHPPVFPGVAESEIGGWRGAAGLAADVRAYGSWMSSEVERGVASLYPAAKMPGGGEAPVVAWVWARTVRCPNPACGIAMPLVRSWWLSKRTGNEAFILASVVQDSNDPAGQRVVFEIGRDLQKLPANVDLGTVGRTGATCIACGTSVKLAFIRDEGRAKRIGASMMAVVADGGRRRAYLAPTAEQIAAAEVEIPADTIGGSLGYYPRDLKAPTYGLTEFSDLFTRRQLVVLTAFSDLVLEARAKVICDGGSEIYANAVATYLGLGVSRMTDISNALCRWENTKEQVRNLFGRQAIPMLWDFAETRPFGKAAGSFEVSLGNLAKAITDTGGPRGVVQQADASARSYDGLVISTDPPYYDNIGYSDLSDFFYVWLRRSLRPIYPELLATMLVPKAEELVANPYRHGKNEAKAFFEDGFRKVFAHARESASQQFPITVWYAFKQSDGDEHGDASTGWETLLEGMIRSGWEITSTWPNRSELSNRMIASGRNALASSIVLSLRPRRPSAPTADRRGFIAALEAELPDALRKLQQGQIAPVDLPQAAIGPGMAVFSRYGAVLEPDGTKMTVRSALTRINEILDQVLNEQEGDFDPTTRFAIAWYRQHGYGVGKFGDADNLARARNTSVDTMDRDEILTSRAGNVQLIKSSQLSWDYDVLKDLHTSNWEALHHLIKVLERDGIAPAGDFLQAALTRPDGAVDADLVKELAHLLFRIAEGNGWTKDALNFNTLVTTWPEILEVARSAKRPPAQQGAFDFEGEDD
ncbi:hypothetical protein Back2_14840 [Nocardioides baekrokdamisoli]|uniref:DUF1156 domain-containing protein n=1 Tax=Nocardioides baekrokdamisoli TaxID=1804624 RepID=A0A3G9IE12_9ACTN|nr:DUF1156 domain-containing protein [Nocardioides baekrokdamisoli]BBH17197.1 hypothetical protein Back2_14840 [Nocardioides baekrokdamisoli]